MKFSEQTQAFYPDDIDYPNLPTDAADIAEGDYAALYDAINQGCYIYIYRKKPVISDPRPDSYHEWDSGSKAWIITDEAEQQKKNDDIAAAELTQQTLINNALQSIGVVQLKLQAKRTLTEAEQGKLDSVLDYIDAVTAIDTSLAPAIEWPELPA